MDTASHPQLASPHGPDALVDVGELREQDVEGSGEGDDGEQGAGADPDELGQRRRLDAGGLGQAGPQLTEQGLARRTPRRGGQRERLEVRPAAARSSGSTTLAAAASARSAPTRSADHVSSSARSVASWLAAAGSTPKPRPVMTGWPPSSIRLPPRRTPWARRASCIVRTARHTDSSRASSTASGGSSSSVGPSTQLKRQDLRAVVERGQRRHLGAGHPAAAGHEEHERLVADLDRHRAAGRGLTGIAELHGAVAAVEDVGVAAVALVHLEEQVGPLRRRGAVQKGAAAVGPQRASAR